MIYNPGRTDSDLLNDKDHPSLVERVFDNPDTIGQGEYTTIYEFLLNPDIRDDPDAIVGTLHEFSGWARYMSDRLLQEFDREAL